DDPPARSMPRSKMAPHVAMGESGTSCVRWGQRKESDRRNYRRRSIKTPYGLATRLRQEPSLTVIPRVCGSPCKVVIKGVGQLLLFENSCNPVLRSWGWRWVLRAHQPDELDPKRILSRWRPSDAHFGVSWGPRGPRLHIRLKSQHEKGW